MKNLDTLPFYRRDLYFIINSVWFERIIIGVIVGNAVAMACLYFPSPGHEYEQTIEYINTACVIIFNVEFLIKFICLHCQYFSNNWNLFDFACVFLSDVGLILPLIYSDMASDVHENNEVKSIFSAFRLFRVVRLFGMIKYFKGIHHIFEALLIALPKLANVAMVLALLLFLFAVIGVNTMGQTQYALIIDRKINFRDFWHALITLVRASTGEDWNMIMHSFSLTPFQTRSIMELECFSSFRVTKYNYDEYVANGWIDHPIKCSNSMCAQVFFMVFTTLISYTILNLFIAVIFESFDDTRTSEEHDTIKRCIQLWPNYDPHLNMEVPLGDALDFIDATLRSQRAAKLEKKKNSGGGDKTSNKKAYDMWDVFGSNWHKPSYSNDYMLRVVQPKTIYAHLPLTEAVASSLYVDGDGNVRFIIAVQACIRELISEFDPVSLAELSIIDSPDIFHPNDDEQTVCRQVAAAYIQTRWLLYKWKKRQAAFEES